MVTNQWRTPSGVEDVGQVVFRLPQYLDPEPGDLMNTGAPRGVAVSGKSPELKAGDVMEIVNDGLGHPQRQTLGKALTND